jgi:hypothetical protein
MYREIGVALALALLALAKNGKETQSASLLLDPFAEKSALPFGHLTPPGLPVLGGFGCMTCRYQCTGQ